MNTHRRQRQSKNHLYVRRRWTCLFVCGLLILPLQLSSGRGGSGNIRRLNTSNNGEPPPDLPVLPPRERQGTSKGNKVQPSFRPARLELPTESHGLEQKQFTSSGRGGSGNVKLSTSSLEAHPVTASILSQHSAVQAQYEQRMREAHAESKVVVSHPTLPVHVRC